MAHLDRQGELGNLSKKTRIELVDLLCRQDKLLGNMKFLQKLPDKGEKIRKFADKLKQLIAEKEQIERTSELFASMKIGSSTVTELDSDDDDEEEENADDTVKDRVMVSESLPSLSDGMSSERTENVIAGNQYESIVKKESVFKKRMASQRGKETENVFLKTGENKPAREIFKPNKTLRSERIPENLTKPQLLLSPKIKENLERDKVEELSAVFPPKLKHPDGTKLLDIKESAQLEQEQQRKYEEAYAQHAAERLTERMNLTMGEDVLDVGDNVYREQTSEESDSESDGESVNDN
ncbi:uncharacterized protein LOC144443893 [Glandiceps talaboti]